MIDATFWLGAEGEERECDTFPSTLDWSFDFRAIMEGLGRDVACVLNSPPWYIRAWRWVWPS